MRATLTAVAVVVTGLAMLAAGGPVLAHHAFSSEFDANKPLTIKATITKMEWTNPHAWLHVDVKGPDGKGVAWLVELAGPNALYRRGWKRQDLPIGAEVTINGYLAKNGSPTINASDVIMSDGRKLFAGSSGTGAPSDR